MRKNILLVLLPFLLVGCSNESIESFFSIISSEEIIETAGYSGVVDGVTFNLEDLGVVKTHTENQTNYLNDPNYEAYEEYTDGKAENSYPLKTKLSWTCSQAGPYKVTVQDESHELPAYIIETEESDCEIDNLMIHTYYVWTVSVNNITSGEAKFMTEDVAPRNLRIEGVKNVRDLGGRVTETGKRIKQNMIIRCGQLTSTNMGNKLISEQGMNYFNNVIHVKSELDLRGQTNTESGNLSGSILGDQVTYKLIGLNYNGNIMSGNRRKFNSIFGFLANEENYPIIFHCSEGTDRAGMLAFIINALLGVSEIDCYRDYLFSNFRNCNGTMNPLSKIKGDNYVDRILETEGDSFQEKTYNLLISYGVAFDYLDRVIEILTVA